MIGINTWIAAPTGGSIGLGFAIPINNAKKAIDDFITKGKVEYGWLGVQIADPAADTYPGVARGPERGQREGRDDPQRLQGLPSEKAGLLPGDYVTRVNGQDIANSNKLTQVVGDLLADKTYDFELIRNGDKMKLTVQLAVRPRRRQRRARLQEPVARAHRGPRQRPGPPAVGGHEHPEGRGRGHDRLRRRGQHPGRPVTGRHGRVPSVRRDHADERA